MRKYLISTSLFLLPLLAAPAPAASRQLISRSTILEAISRHDPIWEKAAQTWNEGLLLGNGDLGVNVWGGGNPLVFSIDKADVWETRHWQPPSTFTWANFQRLLEEGVIQGADASWKKHWGRPKPGGREVTPYPTRIPIGRLELMSVGRPKDFNMRLSLREAAASGSLTTDRGAIRWRCFVAATQPVIVLEYDTDGDEVSAGTRMRNYTGEDPIPGPAHKMLREVFGYPPPEVGTIDGISYWSESMPAGGEYAVAWRQWDLSATRHLVYVTISFTKDRRGAKQEAVDIIRQLDSSDLGPLRQSHLEWWAGYYPASFLSVPDTRLEGLYWMEIYKLGSAARPGKAPITLVGPWAQDGIMPAWQGDYHWDINVQMTYWPVYTANRLELGLPLYDMLDRCRPRMRETARDVIGSGGEFLLLSTGIDCVPHYGWPDAQLAFSALPWAVHHYWLHWEYSQDREFLRNRALPVMKAALQPYLHVLEEKDDGKLHIRWGHSPEYMGSTGNFWGPDPTMDLAAVRFLVDSLIHADKILGTNDPQRPAWERVREKLADFPAHPREGLQPRADLCYESSHRHHSQLVPIYPFVQLTLENDPELVEKSVRHWILRGHGEWVGFSWAWAASIAAHVGRDSLARTLLLDYTDRFVAENTLMFQGAVAGSDMTVWHSGRSLTLESGFGAADAIQNMLLQSHGGVIRVFPASPPAWHSAAFWRLRARGAFLVSAQRSEGKTVFVHIVSEEGGAVRLRTRFAGGAIHVEGPEGARQFSMDGRDVIVDTSPGEKITIWAGDKPAPAIQPIPARPHEEHFFGVKNISRW